MCKRTDIAPHWCPIDGIIVPYNGVHELNEATKCRPNHVRACPHVHRVQMPIEGDECHYHADSGEHREYDGGGCHVGRLLFLKNRPREEI